jgi:hypothetical protein
MTTMLFIAFLIVSCIKAAAHDVLEDLQTIDLENDKAWQTARHLAWEQEKPRYRVDQ